MNQTARKVTAKARGEVAANSEDTRWDYIKEVNAAADTVALAYSDPRIVASPTKKGDAMSAPFTLNAPMTTNQMKSKSFKVGHSAKTGCFTTVKKATQRKSTHVVETITKK